MVRLWKFASDGRGTISVLFASALVVLMAVAGLSFDAANIFKARAAMQAAADGAALAVSADNTTANARVAELAKRYMGANALPASVVQVGAVTAYYNSAAKTVTVTVTGTAQTSFMALLGVSTVDVSVSSKAKRGEYGPLDLVLALDVTGSMKEKIDGVEKIATLKTAATSLIDTVMTTSNARVGIVPFANYVQLGTSYRGADWLSVDPDISEPWCAWSGGASYGNCQYEDYPCTIDGVALTCKRPINCTWAKDTTVPEWKCGVSEYKWNGCVVSRMLNGEYLATIARPTSPRYAGRVAKASMLPPNADAFGCSMMAITNLTNVKSDALKAFGWFYPYGETFIPDGLIWSWNMLTAEAPLESARSYQEMEAIGGQKVLVLMTDGFNTRYAGKDGWHFPIAGDRTNQAKADNATRDICSRMKAEGITVYTVAFGVSDSGIKAILRDCASSPSKFFDAANTSALNSSFSKIGAELQRVRLMQ